MGTKATLGGKTIIGAASWSLRPGVAPVVGAFKMTTADANSLIGRSSTGGGVDSVTLTIKSDVNSDSFEDLSVLHVAPSEEPGTSRVVVADRRWRWPYAYVRRSLNVRRKVGIRRLVTPDNLTTWPIGPNLQYAPWSLIAGNLPWTVDRLLLALEDQISSLDGGPVIRRTSGMPTVPLQDVELDGSLDTVIARALGYMPGVGVTVSQNGAVVFYDTANGAEEKTFGDMGVPVVGSSIPAFTNYARIRPSMIRVLFTPEVELRFDYEDAGDGGTVSRGTDDRYMENVLPLPDYSTSVGGDTLPRGTWVDFDDALPAWGSLPVVGAALTKTMLRLALVPANDLWAGTELSGLASPTADWVARLGVAQTHFRRTFRISRRWMDRIQTLRAYRVATLDTTTGQRGPATVYTDFSYLYTMRSLLVERQAGGNLSYVLNVAGYPSGGTITSSTPGTSAQAQIVDHDQGIVGIDFLADKNRVYEAALPSQVEREGTNTTPGNTVSASAASPSPLMTDRTRPVTFDSLNAEGVPSYALCARHKLSVILTAIPATPNDESGLIAVDVRPSDVGFDEDCVGPVMEIRILPGIETARIAWKDSASDRIQSIFTRTIVSGQTTAEELADLLVNYGGTSDDPQNGASIKGLANAAAARVWQSMRDRTVGTLVTGHASGFRIDGLMQEITTDLSESGIVTTTASVPDRVAPLDLARYLDASTLRILRRIADPGR